MIVDRLCGDENGGKHNTCRTTAPPVPCLPPPATRSRATFHLLLRPAAPDDGGPLSFARDDSRPDQSADRGRSAGSDVSSAKRLQTIVPMTDDREKLLAGLERLRNDPRQWDAYAMTEESRAA
jgi:hypothetical protein